MLGWILWGLLLLLLLLLLAPVALDISYSAQSLRVRLRILGLPLTLVPKKEKPKRAKKAARKKKEKPEEEKPETPEKEKKPVPLMDLLATINDMLPEVGRLLGSSLRHLHIYRCRVTLPVGGEDAAEVGIRYGQMCALCYTIYVYLSSLVKLREWRVTPVPDFTGENPAPFSARLSVAASPAVLLWIGLRFLARGGLVLWRSPLLQARGPARRKIHAPTAG